MPFIVSQNNPQKHKTNEKRESEIIKNYFLPLRVKKKNDPYPMIAAREMLTLKEKTVKTS